jgi:hypothetical protein
MSRVTRKPSRLKKILTTENGSLWLSKGARPQRTEGKQHCNQTDKGNWNKGLQIPKESKGQV